MKTELGLYLRMTHGDDGHDSGDETSGERTEQKNSSCQ